MVRCKLITVLAIVSLPYATFADGLKLSSKSRTDLLRSQLNVLDNRAAAQYSNSVKLQPPSAIVPGTPGALFDVEEANSPYLETAREAASSQNIPEAIFLRLIKQESGWNPGAVSPKGAIGLTQLMPATARLMQVDALAPDENLRGGARYLRMMFDRFGNWPMALAAYNAGPEAVVKYRGIPPYRETQNYVLAILGSP